MAIHTILRHAVYKRLAGIESPIISEVDGANKTACNIIKQLEACALPLKSVAKNTRSMILQNRVLMEIA